MENKASINKNLEYIENAIKLIKTENEKEENKKKENILFPNKEDIIVKYNDLKISLLISKKRFTFESDEKKYQINSKNYDLFVPTVQTIIDELMINNDNIYFEGNNIFSSLEHNCYFLKIFCKYIETYKKHIDANFIPFDYFYKNYFLFDIINDDELKTNEKEKINFIKSKEFYNVLNKFQYKTNEAKNRLYLYVKTVFSILDLYSIKEAEYFAKKVDESNLRIGPCNEEFFINIKKNNLNFYDAVDYIFDVFENEGFKNIDIDFMNDYFNFINFSESFKRTNLISYMMKNTNLSFSRFNSFNC